MAYTIVSACVLVPNRKRDYVALSSDLLQSNIPKVLFLDLVTKTKLNLIDGFNDNCTFVVPFEFSGLCVFKYCADLSTTKICNSSNQLKDTREYFAVIANKTSWLRLAAQKNIFETPNFVWVDFGLAHIFKNCDGFKQALSGLSTYDKIRIGSIWDPRKELNIDWLQHNQPLWAFAGGVFGGDCKSIVRFDDLFQIKLSELLSQNILTWEVNIYYLVFKDCPDIFSAYCSDHDPSLLLNY